VFETLGVVPINLGS